MNPLNVVIYYSIHSIDINAIRENGLDKLHSFYDPLHDSQKREKPTLLKRVEMNAATLFKNYFAYHYTFDAYLVHLDETESIPPTLFQPIKVTDIFL